MCGIIGYIGYQGAQPILLNSLKRLEYRGYDSFGIAVSADDIKIIKAVGRVIDTENDMLQFKGTRGIGHTRWATHGEVSQANAHPHTDCSDRIAVVHNGVIENFLQLRESLTHEGHQFKSDTDTEIIPHLIEKYYKGNLEKAVSRALEDIIGTYAIIVMAQDYPNIIAAKKESPLIVGLDDRQNFAASDVTAILDHTDRVMYLEDGDICNISRTSVKITNNKQEISREEHTVPWGVEEAEKAGYEHFMLKEIHEQPRVIENTFKGLISTMEPQINVFPGTYTDTNSILLLGCGTSYHAALIAEYLVGKLCHIPAQVKTSSEFNFCEIALDKVLVIAITQSGETADTISALKRAQNLGCKTMAITNVPESSITRIANRTFYTKAGVEVGVAATKTFI
ncbi:MAG: glutamine--fructose-6-phosphate transaminase (isomerizing), partial [Dehalococcoidia bacterium]|nr:glutamine--fructose-6-phosphate transaminase (isomerizing) [Dehalococcoidia bacterium]